MGILKSDSPCSRVEALPRADHNLFEVVYTPQSQLRHPLQLFRDMGRDLMASRELAWRLMVRDISAQYRQSFLGIFWAFVPPIATAAGLTLASNADILNVGSTELPYPAYVVFSMTLWQTFVEALNGPMNGVGSARQMLARINFPREALVLSQLGQVFFNFGIKLMLIVALFLWFKMPITWNALLAPVALVHLIALGTAIGLMLTPLAALYQDISRALGVGLSLWLFLTPVIYSAPKQGLFATLVQLNPVTPLLVTTRELATTGTISDPQGFWVTSILALASLLVGWLIYRVSMPFMIERMSA